RTHRLRQRGESTNVREEDRDRPLVAAESRRTLGARDSLGELRREIPLEVAPGDGFLTNAIGLLAVLDGDGGDAGEGDDEIQVFFVELVRRRHVVDVDDAEDALFAEE